MMVQATQYVVKTRSGFFLGKRRHSYRAGGTTVGETTLQHARLFTRKQDAVRSARRGDVVHAVTVTLKEPA
jgi:hypothetical protein